MTGTPRDPGRPGQTDWADALVTAFSSWAAEHRAEAAAEARSRERWLRQQVAEAATLQGTLVDLAEQGADAAVIVGARRVTGRLVGVGADSCVVADRAGAVTIVALAHISAVRVAGRRPGAGEATGTRAPAGAWHLADALAALAAERSPVRIGLRGGETLSGDLISVGDDVLTVRLAAGGMRVHIALTALETCSPQ